MDVSGGTPLEQREGLALQGHPEHRSVDPPSPSMVAWTCDLRLIFAALAVGALPLAGCSSVPSHRPAAPEPREQVVTVTGAIGPPESPKEKQLARELSGIKGESPPQVVTVPRAQEKQLARELSGVKGALP